MIKPPSRRVVMVVDNGVRGDSRVIKSARSVQGAGYEVIVVGHGPREDVVLSGVDVRLFPAEVAKRESSISRWALRTVAMDPGDVRMHRQRMLGPERPGPLGRSALKAAVALRWRLNRWAGWGSHELEMAHTLSMKYPYLGARLGQWEQLDPWLAGIWRGLIHPIIDLQPDLIHAHDYRVLPSVMTAAKELRRQGRHVGTVYDAHEYIPGLVELGEKRRLAAMTIERAHINVADAVITVSEELAQRIQKENRLSTRPTVVCNAPEYPGSVSAGPTLRARVGLDSTTPLMVYAGSVGGSRLLQQCVRALPLLPGVHLALVVSHPTSNVMLALKEVATEHGVSDRLHLTRYVPADSVVDFLKEADVGLVPIKHTANVQNSLPTKTFEYLAAGVPQVVSDLRALSEYVVQHGIGEVFEAESLLGMVAAIQLVLSDRARYTAAITDELISQNSWETQAGQLLGLYDEVLATVGTNGPRKGTADTVRDRHETTNLTLVDSLVADIHLPTLSDSLRLTVLPGGGDFGSQCAQAARLLPDVGVTRAAVGQGLAVGAPPFDWVETGAIASQDDWGDRLLEGLVQTQTHVILEEGWGRVVGRDRHDLLAADVGFLEAGGVTVGQCLSGPFGATGAELDERTKNTVATANWLGLPLFLSTPDILGIMPNATWLPSLHGEGVNHTRTVLAHERPVVLQLMPDLRAMEYEGSEYDLSRLHKDGIIDLLALSKVPEPLVPALLNRVDVVVDQSGSGAFGTLARRTMAAGCLTVTAGSLAWGTRHPQPPVVDAKSAPLADIVRDIAGRTDFYREVAAAGPGYVERWHDGRESARVLAGFLGVAAGKVKS